MGDIICIGGSGLERRRWALDNVLGQYKKSISREKHILENCINADW